MYIYIYMYVVLYTFAQALALQPSGRSGSPAPDLALRKLTFRCAYSYGIGFILIYVPMLRYSGLSDRDWDRVYNYSAPIYWSVAGIG